MDVRISACRGPQKSIFPKTASLKMLRIKLGTRFHGFFRKHFSAAPWHWIS